jgi:hypothetical protein
MMLMYWPHEERLGGLAAIEVSIVPIRMACNPFASQWSSNCLVSYMALHSSLTFP